MNNCCFIGRLGRDPEMRYTPAGKAVVSFSLAVNRDGKKDVSDWIDFIAWEKTAEVIAQYCHKGDLLGVTGALQHRSWEDKEGKKHSAHEVRVIRIDFCGGGKKNNGQSQSANFGALNERMEEFVPIEEDSELPF